MDIYPFGPFNLESLEYKSFRWKYAKDMIKIANGKNKAFKNNLDFSEEELLVYIPGRILEPIGEKKYSLLKNYITKKQNLKIATTTIKDFKFIFEKRWYMEDRNLIRIIEV